MNDIYIAGLVDDIESELKAFIFFWQQADHVMYRARAETIRNIVNRLVEEVEHIEDD